MNVADEVLRAAVSLNAIAAKSYERNALLHARLRAMLNIFENASKQLADLCSSPPKSDTETDIWIRALELHGEAMANAVREIKRARFQS